MLDFVKLMYSGGVNIDEYVSIGSITAGQYKEITGTDYVAPTA